MEREPAVRANCAALRARGAPVEDTLRQIATDRSSDRNARATTARVLAMSNRSAITENLLTQFFSQQESKVELWETTLLLGDIRAVRPPIHALQDVNHDRRHAAARALGWIRNPCNPAVRSLIHALTDVSQRVPVRETRPSPSLISVPPGPSRPWFPCWRIPMFASVSSTKQTGE